MKLSDEIKEKRARTFVSGVLVVWVVCLIGHFVNVFGGL